MNIKKGFDKGAKDYDSTRKKLIPCFDEFYGTALDLIESIDKDNLKVLDLGAGTGIFSSLVFKRYPNTEFVLCDLSNAMLEEAKKGFNQRQQNMNWDTYHSELPFNPSALSLYKWSPIAEELKSLDKKIVLNSVILKWDIIKKEFIERINF